MKKIRLAPNSFKGVLKLLVIMKFFFLLMLACSFQAYSKVFSQDKITLSLKNAKIKHALSAIEHASAYRFIYTDNILPQDATVNIKVRNASLTEVLDELFANTNLTYKMMHDNLIAIGNANEWSNAVPVRGRITDSAGGQPLTGVSIQIKGTNNGTTTDKDGNFSLNAPENAVLQISYVGYSPIEISVAGNKFLNVSLASSTSGLDQAVVIGYGTREKKAITTSIATINANDLAKNITPSPEFAMQGRMPGVYVSGNSGNPMDRPTIRIRGTNTWGVADPLYVIDGVPVTELGAGIEGSDARVQDIRSPVNIMTLINPDDIESISVLKDASAAAIYGVRAANGVILITTKKGKAGKPVLSFTARYGIQNVIKKWDVLNTQQYVDFYKKSYAANPAFALDPWFDPSSPGYLGNTQETYDWQTPLIHKSAPMQDYSLRVSGGSEATDYSFSFGYNKTEGALIEQALERYSLSTKINTRVTSWMNIGINYRLALEQNNSLNPSSLSSIALTPPWQPIYQNGPAFLHGYAPVVPGYDAGGVWSNTKLYGEGTNVNVYGQMANQYLHYEFLRNLGNAYVEFTPLEGLSIKGTVSVDWFRQKRNVFRGYNQNYFDYTSGDPKELGGGTSTGLYNERNVINYTLAKDLSITYDRRFEGHHVNLLLNGSHQKFYGNYMLGETQYMTTTNPDLFLLGGDNQYTKLEADQFRWALAGLLGRLSYDYRSKYYLDLTLRRDGSSRFSPEHRWGTFPAVSAAWRITSEPFMKSTPWLNDLKLRAGWGQLGNQEVRPMAYVSVVATNPMYAFGSVPGGNGIGNYQIGAAIFSFPNPDLKWERTSTTNIGIDAVLFRKLNFTAEYYHKLTKGILQTTSIPPSVGSVENPVANIASVENTGVEFIASYSGRITKYLEYSVGGNFSTVKNKVLSTYQDIPINTSTGRIEKGYSVNYLYGYKADGILQSQAEAEAYNQQYQDAYATQPHQAGDMKFKDLNGAPSKDYRFYTPEPDGKIDDYDRTYLGKTIPGYYYGFNAGLNYKTFDFSVFFQGVGDVQKYNTTLMNLESTSTRGNNMITQVLNAWTPDKPNTDIPRAVVGDPNANERYSSRFVQNAAYLRLSNAQLGYAVPNKVCKMLGGMQFLWFYLSVSNGFVITKWGGLDPENDINPMPRTFTFGISGRF